MARSLETIDLLLEQIDNQHLAAHRRLRADLTEGLSDVNTQLEHLRTAHGHDHDRLLHLQSARDQRKEVSGYQAIILAAAIGGGFRLIEVVINAAVTLVKK